MLNGRLPIMLSVLALTGTARPDIASAAALAGWEESAGLRCVVTDTLDVGACLFDSPDYQQTLVIPSRGTDAYVLSLRAQTVRSLPKSSLKWDPAGNPFPDVTVGVDQGGFLKQDGSMVFVTDHQTIQVQPEPPLVGVLTLETLKSAKPDYVYAAARYTPDPAAIAVFQKVDQPTRIVVFFGSWCSHCKHWMPKLIQSYDQAKNPNLTLEIYGVDEEQSEPADALKSFGVSETPTFIVMRGGKELGRIEEAPEGSSLESDLARFLRTP